MQGNPTINKTRGRPRLSPNGLDRELRTKQVQKRKQKSSRQRVEMHKRQQEKLQRRRRKRLQKQRLKEPIGRTVRKRFKALRYYRHWRVRHSEQEAALRAAQKHQVSVSTIRRWERLYQEGGLAALIPKPPGPQEVPFVVALETQFLVVALRLLLGWNEKRMAKELAQRSLAKISHTSVGRIFRRYHLPTRTYHAKARSNGVSKIRYEKKRPNQQWHIDFAETKLQDGTTVIIVALIDDHSRYCLRCEVVPDMTSETAIQIVQSAWQAFGAPQEIVSDNGRAFTGVFQDSLTAFGHALQQRGIQHRLTTPYWPEGNGKVEAFIKIVKRECLKHPFASLKELQEALASFVSYYNHFRLHSSLAYQTPVSRFLGVASFQGHGLAGIPGLPQELIDLYPPALSVQLHSVNRWSVKQHLALVTLSC